MSEISVKTIGSLMKRHGGMPKDTLEAAQKALDICKERGPDAVESKRALFDMLRVAPAWFRGLLPEILISEDGKELATIPQLAKRHKTTVAEMTKRIRRAEQEAKK